MDAARREPRACPYCGRRPERAIDVRHRYCPWCREFHDDPGRMLHEDRARCPDSIYWFELGSILLDDERRRVERYEALRESSADEVDDASDDGGGEPMLTQEKDERCAVCGSRSKHDFLVSVSGGGGSDLDGRPADALRHVTQYHVHRCPSCGYCAPTISEASPRAGYLVASDAYKAQLDDPSLPYLDQSLLCAAMIYEANESLSHRVVRLRLQAAWACDDGGFPEAAAGCRASVAEAIVNRQRFGGSYFENDLAADYVLLADLYRRAGRLREAREWVENAAAVRRGTQLGQPLCVDYLRELIDAGDTARHTIEEARRRAAGELGAPTPRQVVHDEYRGSDAYLDVLNKLIRAAYLREELQAAEVAKVMGIAFGGQAMTRQVGQMLNEIAEDEVRLGRPMLSVVVVSATGRPGVDFYALARSLGRMADGDDEERFWLSELEAVRRYWRRPLGAQ